MRILFLHIHIGFTKKEIIVEWDVGINCHCHAKYLNLYTHTSTLFNSINKFIVYDSKNLKKTLSKQDVDSE